MSSQFEICASAINVRTERLVVPITRTAHTRAFVMSDSAEIVAKVRIASHNPLHYHRLNALRRSLLWFKGNWHQNRNPLNQSIKTRDAQASLGYPLVRPPTPLTIRQLGVFLASRNNQIVVLILVMPVFSSKTGIHVMRSILYETR